VSDADVDTLKFATEAETTRDDRDNLQFHLNQLGMIRNFWGFSQTDREGVKMTLERQKANWDRMGRGFSTWFPLSNRCWFGSFV